MLVQRRPARAPAPTPALAPAAAGAEAAPAAEHIAAMTRKPLTRMRYALYVTLRLRSTRLQTGRRAWPWIHWTAATSRAAAAAVASRIPVHHEQTIRGRRARPARRSRPTADSTTATFLSRRRLVRCDATRADPAVLKNKFLVDIGWERGVRWSELNDDSEMAAAKDVG